MKLRCIKTTLLFLSENRLLQEPEGPSLGDCCDLLSWQLSIWLKQNPLNFETFNRIEFCAVRPEAGDKVHVFDRTAYINTTIIDSERVERAKTDLEIFGLLKEVVRAGVNLFADHFKVDLSSLNQSLAELQANHYVAKDVLVQRNTKGRKLSLSIEAEMTS